MYRIKKKWKTNRLDKAWDFGEKNKLNYIFVCHLSRPPQVNIVPKIRIWEIVPLKVRQFVFFRLLHTLSQAHSRLFIMCLQPFRKSKHAESFKMCMQNQCLTKCACEIISQIAQIVEVWFLPILVVIKIIKTLKKIGIFEFFLSNALPG